MGRVGVIMDRRFFEHVPGPTHPEHPRRLRAVYEMVEKEFGDSIVMVPTGPATVQDVELVHSPEYIERFLKTAEQDFTMLSPDTPVCKNSYLSAFLAVGSAIQATKVVLGGKLDSCFALIRPPGHHALKDRAMGFCIFDNLAIAVRFAQRYLGIRKVLVIDWDVHFGNGISETFYEDPSVFYISTHRLELFPFSGHPSELGRGEGLGYNLNIVLPPHIQTEDFSGLYQLLLGELIPSFRPEITFVAAGFDAHVMDPLGRLSINEVAFYRITHSLRTYLREIERERIVLALEGGYDPTGLRLCIKETLKALLAPLKGEKQEPTELARELSSDALRRLKGLGPFS